jgi:hypothetical protein
MLAYPHLNMEWLMIGKGRMYKDAPVSAPVPAPESAQIPSDLLFSDYELDETSETAPESDIHAPQVTAETSAPATSDMNPLKQVAQTIVKQRNVSKIIIMFDDGTFQEM